MFSHIMIGTNDLEKAKAFYDPLLATLDVPPGFVDRHRVFYRTKTGVFSVSLPIDGEPATVGQRQHDRFRLQLVRSRPTPGTRLESPTAGRPAKTRRASAKAPPANSISPICAIPTATSCAGCIGWGECSL